MLVKVAKLIKSKIQIVLRSGNNQADNSRVIETEKFLKLCNKTSANHG